MNDLILAKQKISSSQFEKIIEEWGGKFPEHYAGAYVNDDGELVVLTTEDATEHNRSELLSLTCSSEGSVNLSTARFSYNEMKETQYKIDVFISEKTSENPHKLTSWGIYDDLNALVVYTDDISRDNISRFKGTISDSKCIEFRQSFGCALSTTNLNPGKNVYLTNGNGSIGYRVRKTPGENGFVTAGHCTSKTGELARLSNGGSVVGVVTSRQYGGDVDAAYVVTSSAFTPSNTTNSGVSLRTAISTPPVGITVVMEGVKSGLRKGRINSYSASVLMNKTVHLTDQYFANFSSQKGDSGGVVYVESDSSTVGINIGVTDDGQAIITKALRINNAFSLGRY